MKPLGSGSIAVYDAIERRYSLEGQSPSIMQIMQDTGFTSKATIGHHLNRLEQAGWITREPKLQHAIVPVRYPRVHYRHAVPGWVYADDSTHSDDSPSGRNPDRCPDCDRSADAHTDACPHCDDYAVTDYQPQPNTDADAD